MSNIYVYTYVDRVTANYHDGGGVVIITDRDPVDVWNEYATKQNEPDETGYGPNYELALFSPDKEWDWEYELSGEYEEKLMVFGDTGCC